MYYNTIQEGAPYFERKSIVGMKYRDCDDICHELLQEMKTGQYADCDRLPRETELAEHLGISRTRLRDILAQLEREGVITRRHGVGTIINHHVLQVKNRMDMEFEFLDIIRNNGYEPAISKVQLNEDKADSFCANILQISPGTEIACITRICTADERPAIYCEDIFEKRLIHEEFTLNDLKAPIFHFLKKVCGVETYMDLTHLHAVAASKKIAECLGIPVGTPLLNMEEIDYDIDGNVVFYSRQYFVDEFFDQTVLRKKL